MNKTPQYKNYVRQERCANKIKELADDFNKVNSEFLSLLRISNDKVELEFQINNIMTFISCVFAFPTHISLPDYVDNIKMLRKKLKDLAYVPLQVRNVEEEEDEAAE